MGWSMEYKNLVDGWVDQIKAYCCYLDWLMWSGDTAVIEKSEKNIVAFLDVVVAVVSVSSLLVEAVASVCHQMTDALHWHRGLTTELQSLTSALYDCTDTTEQGVRSEAQVCHLGDLMTFCTLGVYWEHTHVHTRFTLQSIFYNHDSLSNKENKIHDMK